MNAQETVRQQLQFWHGTLEQMLSECGPEHLTKNIPGSTANSIAATYVHAVLSEDGMVHGMFQGKPTLFETGGWAEKTGVAPQNGPMQTAEWARSVTLTPAFREYAQAVYGASDAFLANLTDADLERKVQGPIGETTLGWAVALLLGTHTTEHAGEIAAMKGVLGLKGLPF